MSPTRIIAHQKDKNCRHGFRLSEIMTQCLFNVVFTLIIVTLGPKPCVNIFLKFSGRVSHICGPKVARLFIPYLVMSFNNKIIWSNFGINLRGKNIFHKGKV